MDRSQKVLVELLSLALRGRKASYELMNTANWTLVFHLALAHSVIPLVYTSLNHEWIEKDILADFKTIMYRETLKQVRNLDILEKVINKLKEADIPLLAMKGLVLRNLYPFPETRTMSDFDLALKEKDFKNGIRILHQIGFKIAGNGRAVHVIMKYDGDLLWEIHRRLFDKERFMLSQNYLNELWRNAVPVSVCGKSILTFANNDAILYLCLHLAGHYQYGGFGFRQLCDIVVFVEAHHSNIDWEKFYLQAVQLHIFRFVSMIFASCNYLFNMKIPEYLDNKMTPLGKEFLELFIQDIFEGGTFGKSTSERHASNRVLNKVWLRKNKKLSKFSSLLIFLFPMPNKLGEQYLYVKRIPILLPIAWAHRWLYNVINKNQREMMKVLLKKDTAQDSFKIMQNRKELVYWLMNEEQQEKVGNIGLNDESK